MARKAKVRLVIACFIVLVFMIGEVIGELFLEVATVNIIVVFSVISLVRAWSTVNIIVVFSVISLVRAWSTVNIIVVFSVISLVRVWSTVNIIHYITF